METGRETAKTAREFFFCLFVFDFVSAAGTVDVIVVVV